MSLVLSLGKFGWAHKMLDSSSTQCVIVFGSLFTPRRVYELPLSLDHWPESDKNVESTDDVVKDEVDHLLACDRLLSCLASYLFVALGTCAMLKDWKCGSAPLTFARFAIIDVLLASDVLDTWFVTSMESVYSRGLVTPIIFSSLRPASKASTSLALVPLSLESPFVYSSHASGSYSVACLAWLEEIDICMPSLSDTNTDHMASLEAAKYIDRVSLGIRAVIVASSKRSDLSTDHDKNRLRAAIMSFRLHA
ncbi:hypothetical protein Tco_1339154 [Tanacetum coccineum]